jgi:glycosyltransferase involved in cell wall biosynthesis
VVAAAVWGLPVKLICTRHLLYPVRRNPLYRRVDGWIAPTAQMLKTVKSVRTRRTAIIPNWVDLKKYAYKPHAIHNPVTLGVLGQIAPHKGHEDAIEALRQLGAGYRLIIGGKGKDDYVARLREQSRDLPVEFSGFVDFQEFFGQVDILLVPSWEEPFGIVLLESMAAGVPVISTSAGGPQEIIVQGESGILVPAKNPSALADAVRSLAGSESRVASIVKQARLRVETQFDIQNVIPKIEDFYRKVFNALA